MIPGLSVWRPCDAVETIVAWQQALEQQGPSCLLLSRQALPPQEHLPSHVASIRRGAYIIFDCKSSPEAIIMATGSEVSLAIDAARSLTQQGKQVRVISMPSTDRFALQSAAYQDAILPTTVTKRVAVEAGSTDFWYRYVGCRGKVIGIDQFGKSAPGQAVFSTLKLTSQVIIDTVNELL